jgi:metal-responsive CopG/Arc/MetJ family transcriptional regulator
MKRATISLPDDLADRLQREARRRSTSVSEVARDVLSAHFGLGSEEPHRLPFESLGRSGYHHTAREFEEILAEEWRDSRDR